MEPFPSEITFGPYQLHAKIAEGGMAEVFLGTSKQPEYHGQFLAIKKLLNRLNSNKPFVNLLIHEAKVGVLLNHPGIASVFDLGSYKSEFFLTMEYVHGKSLDKIVDKIQAGKAPKLSVEISTFIVLEVLKALAFAHELKDSKGRELNIIHRDISPGNILLGYRGEVKLADFGIATAESRLQSGFSQVALGKLAYMSPEQVVNDPLVRASDIYSLGVVFYQLLSGQLPFHAESANALYKKVIDGKLTDLRMTGPTISPGLRDIVTMCLNRIPRKRFETAPALYNSLVEHFKNEYELDFSTKAVRLYYKKKLSEYLRSCFEAEIIQEIEITQNALKNASNLEEFKVTAPQDLKRISDFSHISDAGGDGPAEATIFEADLTNESTRHYPLTETERQGILKGIAPREAIEATQKQIKSSQKITASAGGFDLATIPEYDLAVEDSKLQRISVKDKLRLSSLDKDHKETLKQQLPEIEISSEIELEKFEVNTFSNKENLDSTRGMSRAEILRDFEKMKEQVTNATSQPARKPKEETKKQPIGKINPPARVSATAKTPITKVPEYFEFKLKKSWVYLGLGILALGLGALGLYLFGINPASIFSN